MARPRWIRWLYFGLALFACSLIISVDAATIEQYQDYSEGISTAQSPSQRGCSTGESSFIVSGRGGLPPRPMGVLDRDRILVDLGLETETSTSTTDVSIHETTNKPLEATEAIGQTFTNEPVSPTDPHRLVQQGRQFYRSGQWHNALAAWRQAEGAFESQGDALSQAMVLSNQALAYQQLDQLFAAEHAITASLTWIYSEDSISERTRTLAQVLNTQARLRLIQGQAQRALRSWEQATDLYRQLGEDTNVIQSLINQSQALRALGFHGRALEILERIDAQLASQPPSLIKAVALYNLGNIRRLVGDPAASQDALEKSLAIAETFESLPDINAALFSLGNTARIIGNYQESLRFYERAAGTATNITERFQAQVNQLAMSIELLEYRHPGYLLLQQIYVQINQLPRSRSSLYAQINFAQSLLKLRQRAKTSWGVADLTTIAQLLANTIQQSKDLYQFHM